MLMDDATNMIEFNWIMQLTSHEKNKYFLNILKIVGQS